jgi:hypothetical protein
MFTTDSGDVRNSVKTKSVLIAVAVYLVLGIVTLGAILLLLLIFGLLAHSICKKEIEAVRRNSTAFNKAFPFRYYGESFGDFQHVFYHQENLENEIVAAIDRELKARTPASALETVTITDIDKDLTAPENREFKKSDCGRTRRGTSITLLLKLSLYGGMQSIRWWVLAGGYVDKNKQFNFVAYAPFTLWRWIFPYLRKEYDVLSRIRTINAASYNDMDVMTQIRCLHEAVFSAMVGELEKNGIDTSDIKAQRMGVMNINISGGRVNMGNVVQGAGNQVAATMAGGKR